MYSDALLNYDCNVTLYNIINDIDLTPLFTCCFLTWQVATERDYSFCQVPATVDGCCMNPEHGRISGTPLPPPYVMLAAAKADALAANSPP